MIHKRSFETFASARVCWCALAFAASGCGVDLSLGELEPAPSPPLVDQGSPSAHAPVYEDAVAPARIAAPEVTLSMGSAHPSLTHNLTVGDLDGDGVDDMAMLEYDAGTRTQFIHLRYGSPRPTDAIGLLELSEGGARLLVQGSGSPGVAVGGVHPVGDFDGDGYADVFVQTSADHLTEGNGGYLLYGGAERLSGVLELRTIASHLEPGPRAGGDAYATYSFAAPGDIDGDGFADLAMTNPVGTPVEPGVYLFYGRARRLLAETPWTDAELQLAYPSLLPRATSTGRDDDGDGVPDLTDQAPTQPTLSRGGDIDGDGLPELLVTYTDLNGTGGTDSRIIVVRGTSVRSTGTLSLLELEPQITYPGAAQDTGAFVASQAIGDLDGDGRGDFIVGSSEDTNHLFYGGPELLSGPIEVSQAAATLPGVYLVPVGDRDGDGDDELVALRPYEDESLVGWPELAGSAAVETLSGTRTRLSGNVTVLPEPRWEDAQVDPGVSGRLVYDVMSAGDLDADGAAELITLSKGTSRSAYAPDSERQLHIHYGVHVPPATPDGPR